MHIFKINFERKKEKILICRASTTRRDISLLDTQYFALMLLLTQVVHCCASPARSHSLIIGKYKIKLNIKTLEIQNSLYSALVMHIKRPDSGILWKTRDRERLYVKGVLQRSTTNQHLTDRDIFNNSRPNQNT